MVLLTELFRYIYIDNWRYAGTDNRPSKKALQLIITVTSDGKQENRDKMVSMLLQLSVCIITLDSSDVIIDHRVE